MVGGDATGRSDGLELPHPQRALVAAKLFAGLEASFAHWEALPGFDLDAAFRVYLSQAFAGDRLAFDRATLKFVALFRNGHTAFDDAWLWHTHGAPLGFDARRFTSGWFVTASARPEIPPGAQVLAVDGEPIETFFAARRGHIAASSDREAAYRFFSRPYLFPAAFRLTLDGEREAPIERGRASLPRPQQPELQWILPDRIALLRIPRFDRPQYEAQAVAAIRAMTPDVRLAVDVRGNNGGDTPAALVATLMTRPYRYWRAITPAHTALSRARGGPRESRELPARGTTRTLWRSLDVSSS